MANDSSAVWFITGVSSGLGQSLAEKALAKGHRVAGTLRNPAHLAGFESLSSDGRALGLIADVTRYPALLAAIDAARERFGGIDLLATNAGYGLTGAIEETSDVEAHEVFETNFFGQLNAIRATLPIMRAQHAGRILIYSAVGGFTGVPGLGIYSAAKAAADVLGESLAQEVAPFGIKVTVLTLGVFRTNFASGSLRHAARAIPEYAESPAGKFRAFRDGLPGNQPNDPDKAAEAILAIAESDNPPRHLALGSDAVGVMRRKLQSVGNDVDDWEKLSASTAFDGAKAH